MVCIVEMRGSSELHTFRYTFRYGCFTMGWLAGPAVAGWPAGCPAGRFAIRFAMDVSLWAGWPGRLWLGGRPAAQPQLGLCIVLPALVHMA